MDLFPAIDLRGGKAVRLLQGDYAQETVYGDDPVALAESFAAAGAKWIHVVDLDAARTGDPINRPVVAAVAAAVRGRAKVQTGGGVRSVADAEALAAAGVARVVMGSAAIKDRTLVAAVFRIVPVAVGLDHRDGDVALHGWTQGSGLNVMDLLDCYPDAEAFIITNIARDGMLAGPDIDGLAAAAAASPIPVIASGGVSSLDDLRMLNRVPGLAGVITGKAIYENRFTVGEALETLAEPS
ncbi:MAG: 1-(5-phosphoribosyl)-5-((5-phosphoribosylamino)methylideneamino)imidazole-4-carboxamide isomerase [Actinobacteria bacterium]|uniref:1-(5-phosphoribosyl)-5-[(5-phosphoribosylamino)methylideneamino]imidazole-4-carboxamideisomerase n=1 Tax=freshwater metagenome TaxID=449393 RepID=A0A6J7P6U7_9ZZZZ|nr:1-(5-phosphoribosyl)-5-((5-phosphoribosylamino)methylideneamino)imidazole-4-carboxamide isomerase [Actinomycetota bacterium]